MGLDFGWAPADVSAKEGQGVVCLLGDLVDVVVPAECLVDVQSQVLRGIDAVQHLPMDSILGHKVINLMSFERQTDR